MKYNYVPFIVALIDFKVKLMVIIMRSNATYEPLIDSTTLPNTIRITEEHIGSVSVQVYYRIKSNLAISLEIIYLLNLCELLITFKKLSTGSIKENRCTNKEKTKSYSCKIEKDL